METEKYRFGPAVFAIKTEIALYRSARYKAFRAPDSEDADFTIEILPLSDDSPFGIRKPVQTEKSGNKITAAMNCSVISELSVGRLMYLTGAAELFLQKDAFVLHASYIIRDGMALLFSAPSGTGKSTQADLWSTCRGCEIVNGDRVLIIRENGKYYAGGIYAAGSSGICRNVTAPLGHIVLLEQAPQCTVKNISVPRKLKRLLCECSYDPHDPGQYNKMMEMLTELLNQVPVLGYGCTMESEAVDVLEKYL